MESKQIIELIASKKQKTVQEITELVKQKMIILAGYISEEGACKIIAHEQGVELKMVEENVNIVEESVTDLGGSQNEEILDLDDLGKKFIKSPKVGESVEFVLKQIKKSKNIDAIDKNGKKFKTNLTSVDYKIVYVTENGEEFSPKSWETVGKVNAICKKLKKISGIELQIKHIKDGMKEKNELDNYYVATKIEGNWKALDRKTNNWI